MERRCTKCTQVKPLSEFDRSGRTSYATYCKACRRIIRRARYVPHPSRISVQPGQRFGRLTVLAEESMVTASRRVACRCDCGTEKIVRLGMLVRGDTASCGCLFREQLIERNRSRPPGPSRHWLYGTWSGMMARCYNPAHQGYRNYGARGIRVCARWADPVAFYADIERLLGPRPDGRTLDRIDNDGSYDPGNVRWATSSEQRRNRRPKEKRNADQARLSAVRT